MLAGASHAVAARGDWVEIQRVLAVDNYIDYLLVNFYIAFMDRLVFAKVIDESFDVRASLCNAFSIRNIRNTGVSSI